MENIYLDKVREFHEVFGHPVSDNLTSLDDLSLRKLRLKLIFEELAELAEALDIKETFSGYCMNYVNSNVDVIDGNKVNVVETLDALCDLQYVLSGGVISLGFLNKFDSAFSHVHDSNMSKACLSEDELKDTIEYYNSIGTMVTHDKIQGKFIVYRAEDMKVLKNKYYKKTKLDDYLN